jgi:putative FmdB family regulatory protein
MRSFDLKCRECGHHFHVESESAWVEEDKHCPECGADEVRQIFKSYLRNGPLFTAEALRNIRDKGSSCCCSAFAAQCELLQDDRPAQADK